MSSGLTKAVETVLGKFDPGGNDAQPLTKASKDKSASAAANRECVEICCQNLHAVKNPLWRVFLYYCVKSLISKVTIVLAWVTQNCDHDLRQTA